MKARILMDTLIFIAIEALIIGFGFVIFHMGMVFADPDILIQMIPVYLISGAFILGGTIIHIDLTFFPEEIAETPKEES